MMEELFELARARVLRKRCFELGLECGGRVA